MNSFLQLFINNLLNWWRKYTLRGNIMNFKMSCLLSLITEKSRNQMCILWFLKILERTSKQIQFKILSKNGHMISYITKPNGILRYLKSNLRLSIFFQPKSINVLKEFKTKFYLKTHMPWNWNLVTSWMHVEWQQNIQAVLWTEIGYHWEISIYNFENIWDFCASIFSLK